jgi:hypothetical protein
MVHQRTSSLHFKIEEASCPGEVLAEVVPMALKEPMVAIVVA